MGSGCLPVEEAAVEGEEEGALVEEDVAGEKSVTILIAAFVCLNGTFPKFCNVSH